MKSSETTKYFLYARKSSEAEDRQIASIESQIAEFERIALREGIEIVEVLSEAKSAKAPGRPVFTYMLKEIERGRAQGILCWKLDRLARNPIDGGQIVWLLQQGTIQHIRSYERSYYPSDNVLMMSVEFGMANQYIRDLSVNVKRGLKEKVSHGILPGVAPIGYLNTVDREKGYRNITEDEMRFPMIRKMWDLMLTGNYTPPQIQEIANKDWGFTTVKRKKVGGSPLCRSTIYKIFNSPFYYGYFEWPKGSGQLHRGTHKPMVTEEEFQRVQALLQRNFKPQPLKKLFSFSGLISCADCGCKITAEEKRQLICTKCKLKFSTNGKTHCPTCLTLIEQMKNSVQLHYVYYHCTHRKASVRCKQPSVEVKELIKQFDTFLSEIELNDRYINWALEHVQKQSKLETDFLTKKYNSLQQSYDQNSLKLDRLLDLKINNMITDTEFQTKRLRLQREKEGLEEELIKDETHQDEFVTYLKETLNFAGNARSWFKQAVETDDYSSQRRIVSYLCSNLTLKDRKLFVGKHKVFEAFAGAIKIIPQASKEFEPEKHLYKIKPEIQPEVSDSRWLAIINSIRNEYESEQLKNTYTGLNKKEWRTF
ncbi:MAG: recombinase family protein [Sphingobacteriales bacterium]|nr:MAG: recombinase family protein [Sphingobacteriales bacterium]